MGEGRDRKSLIDVVPVECKKGTIVILHSNCDLILLTQIVIRGWIIFE